MEALVERVGLLWQWRRGDPQPSIAAPAPSWQMQAVGLRQFARLSPADRRALEHDFALDPQRWRERFALGHQLYLGQIEARVVAFGWRASGESRFGEPTVTFTTPPGSGYLYDFVTHPDWRGQGCYPALLRAIITAETSLADFWIIHHSANRASQRGIARIGFQIACPIYRTASGALALLAGADRERAEAGARLLGLSLISTP